MSERTAAVAHRVDDFMASWDVLESAEIEVNASARQTWCAIVKTDLRDPVIATLFSVPGPANRMARRLAGLRPATREGAVSFGRIAASGRGWQILAEEPDRELVFGAISRFWRKDRSMRRFEPTEFAAFSEPGWAKVVLAFTVEPATGDRSVLRYEARAAGTDDVAASRFRRHWRVIRPGVAMAMKRALGRIRTEAEWHDCLEGALADR